MGYFAEAKTVALIIPESHRKHRVNKIAETLILSMLKLLYTNVKLEISYFFCIDKSLKSI